MPVVHPGGPGSHRTSAPARAALERWRIGGHGCSRPTPATVDETFFVAADDARRRSARPTLSSGLQCRHRMLPSVSSNQAAFSELEHRHARPSSARQVVVGKRYAARLQRRHAGSMRSTRKLSAVCSPSCPRVWGTAPAPCRAPGTGTCRRDAGPVVQAEHLLVEVACPGKVLDRQHAGHFGVTRTSMLALPLPPKVVL